MSRRGASAGRVSLDDMTPEALTRAGVTPELSARIVADSRDRVAWMRARSRGITATDVAQLTSGNAISRAADAKLQGSGFSGNAYTDHGRRREPEIAAWVAATHGIQPSSALFHAVVERDTWPRRTASPSTPTDGSPWPRSRPPTRPGARSPAPICGRSGGSSTCSAPSAPWSSGRSTTSSSPSATNPAARGSTATRRRSPHLVGLATEPDRRAVPADDAADAHAGRPRRPEPVAPPARASRSAPSPSPTDARASAPDPPVPLIGRHASAIL